MANTPLADRLRPTVIDDVVGQKHLLAKGKLLRNIVELGEPPNMIFYGPSGTGKTTHMLNWFKLLKDRAVPVNGDKPLIKLENGKFSAYPTPWCGKEKIRGNKKAPVKAVCFINRSKENRAEEKIHRSVMRLGRF